MNETAYLEKLKNKSSFNRTELFEAIKEEEANLTEANFKYKLNGLLKKGEIVRVGRNAYCLHSKGKINYKYEYSNSSKQIAQIMLEGFPNLDFCIFELSQLNEFINHQIAHNAIFVFIEDSLEDFVFDLLKEKIKQRLLVNPSIEDFNRYREDNVVVLLRLTSESPVKGKGIWEICIEKILVDIFREKLIGFSITDGEKRDLLDQAFDRYNIDESKMFRYARRRNIEETFRLFLKNETNVTLKLEGETK